jgi:plastocyanin
VWESRGHNVKPADVPAESDWTGTEGDRGTTYPSGHVYTHTFEVAGTYDYVCVPHRTSGMVGTVVVE